MTTSANAQEKSASQLPDTSLVVNAGTKINDVIPAKYIYHYAEFLPGRVFFRSGKSSQARMNYNRLLDEMHFITPAGDTLALSDVFNIQYVSFGNDSFYFDQGFILLDTNSAGVKLGVKRGFKLGDRRKAEGYDMMSSDSPITSVQSLYENKRVYNMEVKEETSISTFTQFYFGDKYNHFVLAIEKNLLGMFPKCTNAIKNFQKSNKINYRKKDDLERLVLFASSSCL